ncbi:hypothetical protein C1H46_045507 [Malus baccata]|uniref:Uncharacterized protein n=1 Tax=Malus baccata TaxID=106549 RepID=A0A540K401_MALBA|nr:hypothetical protein C1H46_045507 [Malus baccata]
MVCLILEGCEPVRLLQILKLNECSIPSCQLLLFKYYKIIDYLVLSAKYCNNS